MLTVRTKGTENMYAAALGAGVLLAAAFLAQPAAAQFRYDVEYPTVQYTEKPKDNSIADLIERVEAGEVEFEYSGNRGFFDSLIEALEIDPSSQVLVYSGTSMQYSLIEAETPRALYFSDDAYVAWVQGSNVVEIAAMDARLGPVFYTFENSQRRPGHFLRETNRCLNCHDTQGMMGGGVPELPVRSILVDRFGATFGYETGAMTTDATPLSERWGGWYVTGSHGGQTHLGNILVDRREEIAEIDPAKRFNLDSVEGLFNAEPYLRDTSDIVALMVLEHQVGVPNALTYVSFKAPAVLERMGLADAAEAESWDALPEQAQEMMPRMLDQLVDRLLFVDAITLDEPIAGSSGFDAWFEGQGPRNAQGRSLRDLDLQTRLFTYPVSYQIYSGAFDNLPGFARDYIYRRMADVLEGRDDSGRYAHIEAADRQALREILLETKPDFAPYLELHEQG